jgi:putative tricarboxylic transport membrane protein
LIGPKGLSDAQLAYWDAVLKQLVATEEWKKNLEENLWVPHYMNSRESRIFIEKQNAEIGSILGELGLTVRR